MTIQVLDEKTHVCEKKFFFLPLPHQHHLYLDLRSSSPFHLISFPHPVSLAPPSLLLSASPPLLVSSYPPPSPCQLTPLPLPFILLIVAESIFCQIWITDNKCFKNTLLYLSFLIQVQFSTNMCDCILIESG